LAAEKFADAEPIIVHADGTRPVIVIRDDIPNAKHPRARRLSISANRIAQVDFEPDFALLKEWAGEDEQIKKLFSDDEWREGTGEEPSMADAEPQIDKAAELQEKWQTASGQLWKLGDHRLLIGDCTVRENVERLMGGAEVDMIASDPPYGVDYEYAEYKDTPKAHEGFLDKFWLALPTYKMMVMTPGHSHLSWFFSKSPHSIMIWYDKTKQSPSKAAYLNKFDLILVYGKVLERYAWDVFEIQGVRGDGVRELHTCPKPIELFQALMEAQKEAHIIYEPFGGSGTTILAAENLNRRCYAMEISPTYGGVILQRFLDATGITPELVE
jgi:DNA modification methylase